jgi:hypothetical protein
MRRVAIGFVVTAALACALLLPVAAPASAHTVKDVGAYKFTVGWGSEPAYAGQLNSVQLVIDTLGTGKPYTSLTDTLKVTVIYWQQQMEFALTPTFDPDTGFGTPGDYRAWLFPTAPGNYTFHFTGKVGMQVVDESFTSGPTTFATVEDPMNAQFPVKAPSAVQLSQRLDTALPRLKSSSSSSSGRTYGIIGIAIGALGLIAGGFALVRARA